jgi:AcrR family transcriptional regulator
MPTVTSIKKKMIIHHAAELFRVKGYNAATIRDLASSVGLEPSSLYSHISSKDELLSEICMTCADLFTDGMEKIFYSDLSPKNKIKALIQLHLEIAYEYPASVTVFNDEWKFLQPNVLTKFVQLRQAYEFKFKNILVQGKASGVFDFQNSDIVFSLIMKTLKWSNNAVNKFNKSELDREVSTYILNGLSPKGHSVY